MRQGVRENQRRQYRLFDQSHVWRLHGAWHETHLLQPNQTLSRSRRIGILRNCRVGQPVPEFDITQRTVARQHEQTSEPVPHVSTHLRSRHIHWSQNVLFHWSRRSREQVHVTHDRRYRDGDWLWRSLHCHALLRSTLCKT